MRRVLPRSLAVALATGLLSGGGTANAGGPFLIRSTGQPYVWSTAAPIQYRTDDGPLSATVDQAQAQARVNNMFNTWEAVATASIDFNRAGFIDPTGAFVDGDVSTIVEYDAVQQACDNGTLSPVVYDVDGSLLSILGFDESVVGVAGPCALNATQIISGFVLMNGLFQDGMDNDDLSGNGYDAAIVHEIGHFAGLDHSQINVNCLTGCGADDLAGLPTMFPFLRSDSQLTLSIDDIAWISRLYPDASFATTHGTITGRVFFTDGESQAQLVNVIARRVDTGANEDRVIAVSNVSGYKFRVFHGNSITAPLPDIFRTETPGDLGLFEIPVPAGTYTVVVESISAEFVDGSGVGGDGIRIAMPGTAPAAIGPLAVAAGATVSGNNATLLNTPARFDNHEAP
jgi:hypothetical protein